jgi:hypothetical protein
MTRFKMIGAAAIVSVLSATPALAQRMIDEPGSFAFTYPMGDLGIAWTRPPADAMVMVPDGKMMRHEMHVRSHAMAVGHVDHGR